VSITVYNMATHPEQRFLGKLVLFGFFRTADLGQQCEVVSHEWLANFGLYRHRHFSVITFGVACCFSSQVGLPWFIPSRGFSCVWARTPSLFLVLCYAGLYPRSIIVWKLWHRLRHLIGVGSTAQGFSLTNARHDYILNFKLRSRPPAWI
jgi:hypothetical protein